MSQPNSQDVHSEVNTLSRNQQTRLTNWLKWSLDGVSIEECRERLSSTEGNRMKGNLRRKYAANHRKREGQA